MNVNVTTYKVKFLESGSIEIILSNPEMMKEEYYNKTSVIITKNELPFFLECIKGTAVFYPYFNDISYLLKVYPDGFHYIRLSLSSGKCEERYFTFPNKLSSGLITRIESHIDNPCEDIYEFSETAIKQFSELVSPKITWDYKHIMKGIWTDSPILKRSIYLERIEWNVKESITIRSIQYPELKERLQQLERIAANYSVFGDLITIDISFDGYPTDGIPDSYYFFIHNDKNERIMNGGIIFHPDNRDNPSIGSYSIHT